MHIKQLLEAEHASRVFQTEDQDGAPMAKLKRNTINAR